MDWYNDGRNIGTRAGFLERLGLISRSMTMVVWTAWEEAFFRIFN
jgi:hypothetical protein